MAMPAKGTKRDASPSLEDPPAKKAKAADDAEEPASAERLRDLTAKGWETAQKGWETAQKGWETAQKGWETTQKLLAMAVAELETAQEETNLEKVEAAEKKVEAAEKKVEAAEKKVEAAKKEVEAAKKEVEAAEKKVEAAKKEVVAGPAQELPRPTLEMAVELPELKDEEFKANTLLNVEAFKDFVAPNTTADRPLFLRKHLLNVHNKAVEALQAEEIRLVSLVGCPGTGKTWCGWLVAYTLQKEGKKKTLHLTIRNSTVTTIANLQVKKQYEEVRWNGHMLKQVLRESQCQVCIVDVSVNKPDAALDIFTGIQELLINGSTDPKTEFAGVKFMGLMSGHGQEKITGKQLSLKVLQKLVLWSWSEEEVEALRTKLKDADPPSDEAYKVCGGSVRYLFRPEEDENTIREAVRGLLQDEMKKLLALDMALDDQQGKNRTRLLAFFPRHASNAEDKSFASGIMSAQPMPRSDFVIKNIKENEHAQFDEVAKMYRRLSNMNAGAAGSAFELLVHLFWQEAAARKDTVPLTLRKPGTDDLHWLVSCAQFESRPRSIEEHEGMEIDNDIVGYFTPDSPRYPVLDSILRFKLADKTEVLAIQISIAKDHKHGPLEPLPKLLPPPPTKPQLALWDFRKGEKPCEWKPNESHDWELLHVSCQDFDKRMGCS